MRRRLLPCHWFFKHQSPALTATLQVTIKPTAAPISKYVSSRPVKTHASATIPVNVSSPRQAAQAPQQVTNSDLRPKTSKFSTWTRQHGGKIQLRSVRDRIDFAGGPGRTDGTLINSSRKKKFNWFHLKYYYGKWAAQVGEVLV
ncbi:hypothetical protein B0H19DRAFT_1241101 [Mycena capillaripes]|nr:hypothetical protein B0H19DRAFT_1241101 [Mycena capillaripes]